MAYITNEIKTVEGTSISINDSDQKIFDSLELQGNTIQNGTPTPTAPVPIEVVTGRQEIVIHKKNVIPTNFSEWESGQYKADGTRENNANRIRLKAFVRVEPLTTYYINCFSDDDRLIIREYDINGIFINSIGALVNGGTFTTTNNTHYISVSMYSNTSQTRSYEIYQTLFENGDIKPFICLNSEEDKNYEEYISKTTEINLGKNLFNVENIEIGKTWYGSSNNQRGRFYIKYTPNKIYSITLKSIPSEITGIAVVESSTIDSLSGSQSSQNITNQTSVVRTFNKNAIYLVLQFSVSSGTFTQEIANQIEIQLEKSSSPTLYSTYKTPIELCKIGDYKDFIRKGTGKNLFSETSITEQFTYLISCHIGETYTFSFRGNANSRNRVFLRTYSDIEHSSSVADNVPIYVETTENNYSITLTSTINGYLFFATATGISNYTFNNIQLEEGSTATLYEPYGYANKWYMYKTIGKVVLDGSEDWKKQSNVAYNSYYVDSLISANRTDSSSPYLSNYFTPITVNQRYVNNTFFINLNSRILISYNNITTAQDFKTWLSNNNTTVYYVLATPTTTEITDNELIKQLEYIELLEGINNISVSSGDLSVPLKLSYYSTNNSYYNVIYSQDDKNNLKIKFDGVELADASLKCETIKRTARILPDDGSKRFSLDNFISTSLEVVLHNVDIEDIKDQVEIEIGTLIDLTNNTYQYIPLGIFNIQDTPENNNGKVTLKLRDNRVKFDFNYNAKPLMDNNDGTATKGQILDDICSQANVINTVGRFNGDEDLVGIYDNTIQGTTYVSYLMEQAGLIPTIDRLGRLKAIELDKLYVWRIPLSILEGYEMGDPYKIERAVYESGTIKYETSQDETLDTLYLDSANPYISNSSQIDYILNKLQNFEIDSVKTKKVLGNPTIDPYDLIQVYNDLDGTNDVIFTTLANTSYTFNGVHRDNFATQIGKEERTENVSIKGEGTFQKWAKSEIDNVNSKIENQTGEIQTINETLDNTYTKGQVDTLVQTAQTGLTNTFSEAGGNNIFRNTGLWFEQNGGETKTGKNIFNISTVLTGKIVNSSGVVENNTVWNTSDKIIVTPNTTICWSYETVGAGQLLIAEYNSSNTLVNRTIADYRTNINNQVSLTTNSATSYVRVGYRNDLTRDNLQLEYNNVRTSYSPYYTYTNNYEFWEGPVVKQKEEKASNMNALKLQLGNLSQNQIVSSGTYTVSFKYKKLSNLSDVVVKVIINDNEYILNQLTDTEFVTGQKDSEGNYITQPLVVGDNKNIKVEFITNLNDSCEIYDLMVNAGEVKLAYSQNQNETTTDTVNISKGITITSTDLDVTFKANADGIRTLDKNNNELTKFTDTGMTTKEAIIENTSKIVGLQFQEVNGQTWITRL